MKLYGKPTLLGMQTKLTKMHNISGMRINFEHNQQSRCSSQMCIIAEKCMAKHTAAYSHCLLSICWAVVAGKKDGK